MDESLFPGITNPARRRRLLLQHAAREARDIAEAARRQMEHPSIAGADPDPELLNRATRLQRTILAAARIADPPAPRPRAGKSPPPE